MEVFSVNNPYYIEPLGGFNLGQAAMNIGQAYQQKQADQAKRQSLEDAARVFSEGTPAQQAEFMLKNPELRANLEAAQGFKSDQTKAYRLDATKRILLGESGDDVIDQTAMKIKEAGGDPSDILALKGRPPEDLQRIARYQLALIDPAAAKAFSDANRISEGESPKIGTYNPRDYTVESFAEFNRTGDPGVLKRYTEKTIMVGGVPHMLDTATGGYIPMKTAGEIGKDKAEIEKIVTTARDQAKADVANKIKKEGQLGKIEDADRVYQDLASADLDKIYGRGESLYPNYLRSQEGIDLQAKRDQLVSMLQLGARGELKGQGPITEGEQKILSDSVTVLGNPDISPEAAKKALDDSMSILYRNAGMEFSAEPESNKMFSQALGRAITEQDIQDTLRANPGITREQLLNQLQVQNGRSTR